MDQLLNEIESYWSTRTEGYSEVNEKELKGIQKNAWLKTLESNFPDKKKEELRILDIVHKVEPHGNKGITLRIHFNQSSLVKGTVGHGLAQNVGTLTAGILDFSGGRMLVVGGCGCGIDAVRCC